MKMSGNTMLITGGGSGIGMGLAQKFHDLGNTVIVAGRRQDALDDVIKGRANMVGMTLDISEAAAVSSFAKALIKAHPAINVLMNNAGIMHTETLETRRDLAYTEATITTNLLGPIRLIDALVDHLASQPDAAIINVTSGLGFVPLTFAATYSATKAALHSYTIALRGALQDRIEVIELVPPGVQTGLTPGQKTRPGYQPLDEFIDEVMSLFTTAPGPEILVERVRPLRSAEADHRFPEAFKMMNDFARKARETQP